jgi:alpha-mannosidase
MQTERHQGSLPAEHSFVQIGPDNVVLTAFKKAEDENSLILRFYEWEGRESDVTVQLPGRAQSAEETDLMERPIGNLSMHAGAVTVRTKPYEIKTIKVRFAAETARDNVKKQGSPVSP